MKTNIQRLYQTINGPLILKLAFPSLLLLFSYNNPERTGVSKPPIIRKELKVDSTFRSIQIEGDISVMLTNDPAGTIIIEGKENELNKIRPVFKNDVLFIYLNRKNIFSKLTLYLSVTTLQAIRLNGDANISSIESIKADHLHLSLNGNIKVKVNTVGHLSVDTPDDIELIWKSPSLNRKK